MKGRQKRDCLIKDHITNLELNCDLLLLIYTFNMWYVTFIIRLRMILNINIYK